MASKKKNKKIAPFVFFCQEKKECEPQFSNLSLAQLTSNKEISGLWEALTTEERQAYVDMSKLHQDNQWTRPSLSFSSSSSSSKKEDLRGKFDSFGRSLLALEQNRILNAFMDEVKLRDIKRMTQSFNDQQRIMLSRRFFIIEMTPWIEYVDQDIAVPAELGFLEFTLERGVQKYWSQLIHPGQIRQGHKGQIKVDSDRTHKIWLDNPELCNNYKAIVQRLADFLALKLDEFVPGEIEGLQIPPEIENLIQVRKRELALKERRFCPMFVMPNQMATVQRSLKWLIQKSGLHHFHFEIYPLPALFHAFLNEAPTSEYFNEETKISYTPAIVEATLQRDIFLYSPTVCCPYHAGLENPFCAVSSAARRAFTILDFACQVYEIEPVQGYHYPYGVPHFKDIQESLNETISSGVSINSGMYPNCDEEGGDKEYSLNTKGGDSRSSTPLSYSDFTHGAKQYEPRHILHKFLEDDRSGVEEEDAAATKFVPKKYAFKNREDILSQKRVYPDFLIEFLYKDDLEREKREFEKENEELFKYQTFDDYLEMYTTAELTTGDFMDSEYTGGGGRETVFQDAD